MAPVNSRASAAKWWAGSRSRKLAIGPTPLRPLGKGFPQGLGGIAQGADELPIR